VDSGFRTSWVELFTRGEVERELKLQAARGQLAPRPAEQLALLAQLSTDHDAAVAEAARQTLDALPAGRVAALMARPDAPADLRQFFEQRGIAPGPALADDDLPLIDSGSAPPEAGAASPDDAAGNEPSAEVTRQISAMTVPERLALAMKGPREARAVLIRDPNKLIALAVLSSPKVTETEVEAFARMSNVVEDVLRTIASTRAWVKSYAIASALVRNPKTPLAISMNLLPRLNDRDLRGVSTDRNIPEVLRATARRRVAVDKR